MNKPGPEERAELNIRAAEAARAVLQKTIGNRFVVLVAVEPDGSTDISPIATAGDGENCRAALAVAGSIGMLLENLERARATLPKKPAPVPDRDPGKEPN